MRPSIPDRRVKQSAAKCQGACKYRSIWILLITGLFFISEPPTNGKMPLVHQSKGNLPIGSSSQGLFIYLDKYTVNNPGDNFQVVGRENINPVDFSKTSKESLRSTIQAGHVPGWAPATQIVINYRVVMVVMIITELSWSFA